MSENLFLQSAVKKENLGVWEISHISGFFI